MDDQSALRCNVCGRTISAVEVEEGRAMMVLGKHYCPSCLSRAIERARDPDELPEHDTPRAIPQERRRHIRKETDLSLEITLYDSAGVLCDRGTGIMRNISLSGALLTGVLLSQTTVPSGPGRIGIRLLKGELQEFEILGRVVRSERGKEGMDIALEFDRKERAKVERVRKVI